jgi:hypothetical protein
LQISEIEPAGNDIVFGKVVGANGVGGIWRDLGMLVSIVGKEPEELARLCVPLAVLNDAKATVLALAILRDRVLDRYAAWRLLEVKALKWLTTVSGLPGLKWKEVIDRVWEEISIGRRK